MRYVNHFFALLAVVALTSSLYAADPAPAGDKPAGDTPADKPAQKHSVVHGMVKKIDGKSITVTTGKGDKAKEVVVETDDSTKFTVDHEPAKLTDVKDGELVAITPAVGIAHHVDINTTHKDTKHAVVHGIVKKVDGKAITVSVGTGEGKEVVVETDDSTKFTVDHEPGKMEDIKVGELIAVTPAEGVAHHVDLNTTHKAAK